LRDVILADREATLALGRTLARSLRGGDAIALIGELGAGKTTLVAGLVEVAAGEQASSPTFALINEYRGGALVVWHIDLYRIEREAELVELGLDDIVGASRGVCVIEWADRYPVMPPDHLRIELSFDALGRRARLAGTGPRGRALAEVVG
jgi:tRNA threonylcarbamoyl adenosine modification protein YjeE